MIFRKKDEKIPSYRWKIRKIGLVPEFFNQLRTRLNLRAFNHLLVVSDEEFLSKL